MEKVAVYVSTKTKNKYELQRRLSRISNYCLLKNYDYVLYVDDVKNRLDIKNRKALEELKAEIKEGKISKVIIQDVNQLSKNSASNLEFIEFLENNNCHIECIDGTDLHKYYEFYREIIKRINKEEMSK